MKKRTMKKSTDYVTKSDLKQGLDDVKEGMKEGFDKVRKEFKEEMRGFKDEIMTGIDGVMKELVAMREDSTIGTYQIRNLREDVDGHEKRIAKLESTVQQ